MEQHPRKPPDLGYAPQGTTEPEQPMFSNSQRKIRKLDLFTEWSCLPILDRQLLGTLFKM